MYYRENAPKPEMLVRPNVALFTFHKDYITKKKHTFHFSVGLERDGKLEIAGFESSRSP